MSNLKPARHGERAEDNTDLRASLERHGQLQPIIATQDGDVIVGERRRQTLTALGIEPEVRIIDVDEIGALLLRLSEEFSKHDMPFVVRANALAELWRLLKARDPKAQQADLARMIGTGTATVGELLSIARLPDEVQQLAEEGKVGREAARQLARSGLPNEEKAAIARKIADRKIPADLAGMKVSEVVDFVEKASPAVRKKLVSNPRVTYDDAQRLAQKEKEREEREAMADVEAAMWRARSYFHKLREKTRLYAQGLRLSAPLAIEVPEDDYDMTKQAVTDLRAACDEFLVALDAEPQRASNGNVPRRMVAQLQAAESALDLTYDG